MPLPGPRGRSRAASPCAPAPRPKPKRSAGRVKRPRPPSALDRPFAAGLPLQLQDSVEQSLGGRRAAGDVDVDGDNAIAPAHDAVAIVIIAAAIGAAAHRDDVARLAHLVVDAAEGRS